jgi:hypothetical protein
MYRAMGLQNTSNRLDSKRKFSSHPRLFAGEREIDPQLWLNYRMSDSQRRRSCSAARAPRPKTLPPPFSGCLAQS